MLSKLLNLEALKISKKEIFFLFILFPAIFFNLGMPTLSYNFISGYILILFFGIYIFFRNLIIEEKFGSNIFLNIFGIIAILSFITTSEMFHANKYRNLLGEVKETSFDKNISPIDIDKIRVVDKEYAKLLAEKKLGSDPALGSRTVLGDFHIQKIKEDLYWVAPLLHSGFFKYLNKKEGTPGFVMISATNPSKIKLDLKHKIKYQPNAYFLDNLKRHIYINGYANVGKTDYTFELDDNLNPHYVVTLYKKTIGFSGNKVYGILIVNPTNGEIKFHDLKNIPKWVDRVIPEDFVEDQIKYWGLYIKQDSNSFNNWINATFINEGTLKETPGTSLVYGKDGNSDWYTGLTSTGSDGSTVGFMLVDSRTKKATWFKQSGATEEKAKKSAEGEVQEKRYTATDPILYNVLGIPTYFTTLKADDGTVKLVAFISVEQFNIVGVGKTKKEALRKYQSLLNSKGNNIKIKSTVETIDLKGNIKRINQNMREGNSFYYFKLENYPKVFIMDSSLSDDIVLTQKGDIVHITFENSKMNYININKFENTTFQNILKTKRNKNELKRDFKSNR